MKIFPFLKVKPYPKRTYQLYTNVSTNLLHLLPLHADIRYSTGDEFLAATTNVNTFDVPFYNYFYSIHRKKDHVVWSRIDGHPYKQSVDGCDIIDTASSDVYNMYPYTIEEIAELQPGDSLGQIKNVTDEGKIEFFPSSDELYIADASGEVLDFLFGANHTIAYSSIRQFYVYKDYKIYKIDIDSCPDAKDNGDIVYANELETKYTTYLRPQQYQNPFDDKSHTYASIPAIASGENNLYYDNITAADGSKFSMVALSGVVGDRWRVTFGGSEAVEGTMTVRKAGKTVFAYASSPVTSCRVDIWRADGGEVIVGGIGISNESFDVGATKRDFESALNDYSPSKQSEIDGAIDYIPGIATNNFTIRTITKIENADSLDKLLDDIIEMKRERMAFDIGDYWHEKDHINTALMRVARVKSATSRSKTGKIEGSEIQYIETTWQIGEAS